MILPQPGVSILLAPNRLWIVGQHSLEQPSMHEAGAPLHLSPIV